MAYHLGIDAVGNHHSGGATILIDLLQAATADYRVERISVFCSPRNMRDFDLPFSEKIVEVENSCADRNYLYRVLWAEHLLGRTCEKLAVDVLLCVNGIGRAYTPIPHVTYIQQSLPFSPQAMRTCSWLFQQRMRLLGYLMRRSCRNSALVIAQTPTMQRRLSETFQLGSGRIVHYLPPVYPLHDSTLISSPALERVQAIPENSRLLYVGNMAPYKNIRVALEAMKLIRRHFPEATLFLTAPPDHPLCQTEGVVGLGFLERAELYKVIRSVTVLVQPSLVESATLPVAEAMINGTSTLVSDLPYAHDMCEHAGTYFDPLSSESFADKAVLLMQNPALRKERIQQGIEIMNDRLTHNSYDELIDKLVRVAIGRF